MKCHPHEQPTKPSSGIVTIAADAFFDSLHRFSTSAVVVRGGGISLFRHTRFGIFENQSGHYCDDVSELAIRLEAVTQIRFFTERDEIRGFGIDFRGVGSSLAVYPRRGAHNDAVFDEIAETGRHEVDTIDAESWLGERLRSHGTTWHNQILCADTAEPILEVGLDSPALRTRCSLHPDHIDREGEVWSVAERGTQTAVHFAPSDPTLSCDLGTAVTHRFQQLPYAV